MLSITYFYREPRNTGWSIEGIFTSVKNCLKGKADIREFYCDASLSRIKNTLAARRHSGAINHITGDVNFLALGLKGKVILTIHDLGHYNTLRRSPFKRYIYKLFWLKYPLKRVDMVTVISEFTRDSLLQYFSYPADRIRIVPDPVKPVFRYTPKEAMNAVPRIMHIGTSRHKNLDGLIEAVKGMNVHLDIVADLDDAFKQKLADYKVAYTTYDKPGDEELYQCYAACDMLYFASFYEGFGMPIIEAQAVGRPVITSNAGAMKEVANGSAYLVDPNSIQEIKEAIEAIIADKKLYADLVAAGAKNAARFDCDKIANDYLAVYNEVAALP